MSTTERVEHQAAYRVAFLDWLACATAGRTERASKAVAALGSDLPADVAVVATAGHVLDFDDTAGDGVAHVSAATAPAALVVAASMGLTSGDVLEAYAQGYEAMAAVAAASHPALYSAGWHPTAVCGPIGAAVAAARLLELDDAARDTAISLAMLRAGGSRGAFGSDGKSIQVGFAAAAGVAGALLAKAGARVGRDSLLGAYGFVSVFGAHWPDDLWEPRASPAIARNWVKLYPSCLGTHSPIEAAEISRAKGPGLDPLAHEVEVAVHPVGRQAAHIDTATDGLSAKFSIPYCVAYTFLHGPPTRASLEALDPRVAEAAARIRVSVNESLPEFGASLRADGVEVARVPYPRGAPERPIDENGLNDKIADLAGSRLDGILDDLTVPAGRVLEAAGFAALAAVAEC